MGQRASLGPFVAADCFLRHIARKRHVNKDGVVSWEVFDDLHPTLSFTHQDAGLQTDAGLDRYQRYRQLLPSRDLPGICRLSFVDLTEGLEPPLPPTRDPDPEDKVYGHLHCCTRRPANQIHMVAMAKLATKNGIVREFVPKRKRRL